MPAWGLGKIIELTHDRVWVYFKDIERTPKDAVKQLAVAPAHLRLAEIQSDPHLDNLPPMVHQGKLSVPSAKGCGPGVFLRSAVRRAPELWWRAGAERCARICGMGGGAGGEGMTMAKPRATISITLPPWPGKSEAHKWRGDIRWLLKDAVEASNVELSRDSQVEVEAEVFLQRASKGAEGQDVDNLLKHTCDALQARLGGPKGKVRKGRLITNDCQVFRAVIQKRYLDKANSSGGRLIVRPYTGAV
jgi:Holliday junction resolvase RusA-like endonuclease